MSKGTCVRLVLLVFGLFALAACSGPPPGYTAGPGQQPGQGDPWGAEPDSEGGAACDQARCEDFCWYAACLFEGDMTGDICQAQCMSNCGDGFFDDVDSSMMDCMAATGPDLMCANAQACCDNNLTNQLCP